jgi:N6-L-threonylcarbamoyladenine synthase
MENFLAGLVSSQIQLHAEYGGVVPEVGRGSVSESDALAKAALEAAQVKTEELGAMAATQGPGFRTQWSGILNGGAFCRQCHCA